MGERESKDVQVEVGPSRLEDSENTISGQRSEITDEVFSNPLLIDKIVKYSMHKANGKDYDRQTFAAVRLVNKIWLQSASRALEDLDKPLTIIKLGLDDSESGLNDHDFDVNKGNILEHFVSTFSKYCRSSESVFPIGLFLVPEFFLREDESFASFLEQFGDHVFFLYVIYPITSATLTLKCGHISFHNLRNLCFMFEWEQGHADELNANDFKNGLTLVQEILQNTSKLNTFVLVTSLMTSANISSLSFPLTIESINLDCELTSQNSTSMRSSNLPNLKNLDLVVRKKSEADVIFQVLKNVGQHLKCLNLQVISKITEPLTLIRFPLMEKLTRFQISGRHFEFAPELKYVWPKLVPNLTSLVLENIEEYLFLNLVQGSRFENVENLKFSLNVSPKESVLKEMLASFPNIQELSLQFRINEVSGLKFLFRNFTHLKNLGLEFDIDVVDDSMNYKLVSCILGVSFKFAKQIFDNKEGNHMVPMDNPESIMNLTGLNSLSLRSSKNDSLGSAVILPCSKIILKHGLEKMPNLQDIKVLNRYGFGCKLK